MPLTLSHAFSATAPIRLEGEAHPEKLTPLSEYSSEAREALEQRLHQYYTDYNPGQIGNVATILSAFEQNPSCIFPTLDQKYGTAASTPEEGRQLLVYRAMVQRQKDQRAPPPFKEVDLEEDAMQLAQVPRESAILCCGLVVQLRERGTKNAAQHFRKHVWKDQFLRLQESTLELYKTTECKVSHGCAMLSRQGTFIMAVRPRFKVARVGRENLRFYADMEEEELGGAAGGGGEEEDDEDEPGFTVLLTTGERWDLRVKGVRSKGRGLADAWIHAITHNMQREREHGTPR